MSVGTSGTITKPVANVPTRPPAVAHADSRPTTEPVSARSRSCIRATVGVTALSTAAGGNSATSVTVKAAASPPPRSASPSPRDERDGEHRQHAAGREQDRQQPPLVEPVGRAAADRGAGRDPGQDGADDRGRRLERQPDVRRQQPDPEDLEHQHRAGGDEDEAGRHDRDPMG